MTAYETVTARLAEVTGYDPGGNGKRSYRCPAHDDSSPSLSVTDGGDRVLLKCQAGCDTDRVLDALKLTKADLFDEVKPSEQPRIVATYDYTDPAGGLLYQVVRRSPKTFRQRRPDGHGSWEWNLQGVTRVLYRLPKVIDAVTAGVTIFVAEGEKDVEALDRAGEVATCNAGGAGKWRPEYAEALAGAAHVVIVADRDQPGYRHARDVLQALHGKADRIDVVQARSGKDAADHLAAGHSTEAFEVITDELDKLCEDQGGDDTLVTDKADGDLADWTTPIDWAEFWSTETPDQEWLIEPVVPAGRQVAIFSRAKTGKSLLALDGCAALATGRPVLGARPATPVDVVYVDLEMTEADVKERLEDLGYGPDSDLSRFHYYLLPSLPPLDGDFGGQVIEAIAKRYDAHLVVIDTMARAVNGDENLSDTYRDFYRHTGRRLKAAGVALLRLDHGGKDLAQGQRGSSGKNDDVDVVFMLTTDDAGFTLKRTHTRIPWVPALVQFQRHTEPLCHILTSGLWPEGTKDVASDLDNLGVPLDATANQATAALRDGAGKGRRKNVVIAALKYRRQAYRSAQPDPPFVRSAECQETT